MTWLTIEYVRLTPKTSTSARPGRRTTGTLSAVSAAAGGVTGRSRASAVDCALTEGAAASAATNRGRQTRHRRAAPTVRPALCPSKTHGCRMFVLPAGRTARAREPNGGVTRRWAGAIVGAPNHGQRGAAPATRG